MTILLDTPYAKCDSIIDNEIAAKLKKCNVTTLITVGKLIDVLIDQQEMIKKRSLIDIMKRSPLTVQSELLWGSFLQHNILIL